MYSLLLKIKEISRSLSPFEFWPEASSCSLDVVIPDLSPAFSWSELSSSEESQIRSWLPELDGDASQVLGSLCFSNGTPVVHNFVVK
jgi:hypothetical protein